MSTQNGEEESVCVSVCGSNIDKLWRQRTTLEKIFIAILVGTTILLIGFLIFITIKYATTPKICTTSGCLTAASQILAHIDLTVNPCDDFFKFACGRFIRNSHGDIAAASVKKIIRQVERRLAEIIKEPIKDDDNYWMKNQKRFLEACMNETVVGEDTMDEFNETLKELNGWPVVSGYKWNEGVFDWKEIVYKLKSRGYVNSMLLNVNTVADPFNNSNRHIAIVLIPYPEKINNEHKVLYKKYMTSIAVKLGADRNRAAIEMEKVMDLMENLKKIADEKTLRFNESAELNVTAELLKTRFTVERYQEMNGDIDWLDFINNILEPVARINSDDHVIFPDIEYTEAYFKLLQKTSKRTLANYIIWRLLDSIMQYMPKNFQQFKEEYICLAKKSSIEKNRFKFCKKEIKKSYNYQTPPSHIVYARRYLPKDQRRTIEEMVKNIKLEFIELLEKNSWMDTETKNKALEKMRNLKEIIGAPGNYFNDVILKPVFGDDSIEIRNDSFIKMLLDQYKLKQEYVYFRLHLNVNDVALEPFYAFITTVNAMYSFYDNAMIIPVGILEDVFYDTNRPMYLNYGAIGSIVGHEITHGFGEFGSAYDKNGHKHTIWSNKTLEAYKEKTKCIIEEVENFNFTDEDVQINGTLTLEENVADYTGLRISYGAYKKWINQYGTEPSLPEINYTPQQLFWISAVLYECFEFNKDSGLKEDLYHAHNSFRVIAPLRNNPNFVKDFNCPIDSRMNSEEKCQIF